MIDISGFYLFRVIYIIYIFICIFDIMIIKSNNVYLLNMQIYFNMTTFKLYVFRLIWRLARRCAQVHHGT